MGYRKPALNWRRLYGTGMRIQRRDAEIAEISSASGCRRIEQAVSLPGAEKNGIWARFLGVEAGIENKGLNSDSQASAEKTGERTKNEINGRGRWERRARREVAARMVVMGLLLPMCLGAQDADLMTTVWNGVQRAQQEFTSGCGKIVETRTSLLLARPMVFRGKFCAAGMDRFALEYTEPEPVRILFNKDYLNVTTDGGRKTEVMDVGGNVRRTQAYFSRDKSLGNLKKNFEIAVSREPGLYVMKMVPRTESFRRKIAQIVVKLDAAKFLLRSLEVNGKSG